MALTRGKSPKKSSSVPAGSRRRLLLKRAGIALTALIIILLVIFFLLPVWISNEQGRAYILERLNRRLNGAASTDPASGGSGAGVKLSIDDWSLGWFRGTELKGVRLTHPDGSVLLTCPHIDSGLTLWDIVWGNYDLHMTTLDDLRLSVSRYPDGHTSLAAFAAHQEFADVFRTLRGAIQVNSGVVTFGSVTSATAVTYELKASLTIASAQSPFHLQVSGIDPTTGSDVSLNGTFPPIGLLSGGTAGGEGVPTWEILGDLEFAATNLPTGLACEYAGLDPRWSESWGERLQSARLSNHAAPALGVSRPMIILRGQNDAYLEARLLLRMRPPKSAGTGGNPSEAVRLTLPAGGTGTDEEYLLQALLPVSPPLAQLLSRINPIFGELHSSQGSVQVRVTSLDMPLGTGNATASGRLTFPPVTFTPHPRGLIAQLMAAAGEPAAGAAGSGGVAATDLPGEIGACRIELANQRLSFENLALTLGRRKLSMTGGVGLDNSVDMVVTIPGAGSGLTSQTARVTIKGTVAEPLVKPAD